MKGNKVACYLDDKLVQQAAEKPSPRKVAPQEEQVTTIKQQLKYALPANLFVELRVPCQ